MRKIINKNINIKVIIILVFLFLSFGFYYRENIKEWLINITKIESYSLETIPEYSGKMFVYIDNNKPNFSGSDKKTTSFERYSELDSLGRCGVAIGNISIELMPTKDRESIGMIKPSGWNLTKYDIVPGKYLYNRCHLIAYQLAGENANEQNLITCTKNMNSKGMLPFENKVAEYIKETKNHVLYRVTPIFKGNNLLASGVQIEAHSIEDDGIGVSFNVYIYNNQDGVLIDYSNGESELLK